MVFAINWLNFTFGGYVRCLLYLLLSHFSHVCMLALPDLKRISVFVCVFVRDTGRIADF